MVADRPAMAGSRRPQCRERGVQRRSVADLAAPGCHPGGACREAGIDFDQKRALCGRRIKRPERNAPAQPMEQAHPRKACLAYLCRADKVEIADARGLPRRTLVLFDDAESPCAGFEEVADIARRVAEVATCLDMRQEAPGLEMRVGRR